MSLEALTQPITKVTCSAERRDKKKTNQFRDLGKDSLLVQFLNFLKIDKSERIVSFSLRGF